MKPEPTDQPIVAERNKKFLARYFHDGSWWNIHFYAADFNDAQAVCDAHNLQLDGEHKMTVPAVGGSWLPNIVIRLANWWKGRTSDD